MTEVTNQFPSLQLTEPVVLSRIKKLEDNSQCSLQVFIKDIKLSCFSQFFDCGYARVQYFLQLLA